MKPKSKASPFLLPFPQKHPDESPKDFSTRALRSLAQAMNAKKEQDEENEMVKNEMSYRGRFKKR